MIIEQIYTNCLAQAAYYIESEGEAAIIDPIREYEPYVKLAAENGAAIKYIFETHFHADFVSGHIDLSKATLAPIVYGSKAQCGFDCILAEDGEEFKIGKVKIRVLHTPGHTPESVCFLLIDEKDQPHAIFTGDTLFVGDVGRPDLCQAGANMSKEQMAAMLYDSLHSKITTLPDEVMLYPGHGPGSACGKNLGPDTFSTLGNEKKHNYALQAKTVEEFISAVTEGMSEPPSYFFEDASLNQKGYASIDELLALASPLDPARFEQCIRDGALVIDSRKPDDFETGFVPGSINIGLNGQYAIWAATLYNLDRKIILVADAGQEEESIVRLTRVGFSNISGFLQGGIQAWKDAGKPIDMVISITPEEFALDHKFSDDTTLDVRKPAEWESGHVKGATWLNLEDLQAKMEDLDRDHTYLIHCAGGYRSMIAASMMKKNGFHRVKNILGGWGKIKETQVEKEVPAVQNA